MKDTKPRLVSDVKSKPQTADEEGVPLIVNRRWNVTSIRNEADEAMRFLGSGVVDLSNDAAREMLTGWLVDFAEQVLRRASGDFERAAAKGIAQALNMIRDPDYYETIKERRRRQTRNYQADQEEREIEARRRRLNPTPKEREYDIKMYQDWIKRDEVRVNEMRLRLAELESQVETPDELLM